jgi:hypothetical protein
MSDQNKDLAPSFESLALAELIRLTTLSDHAKSEAEIVGAQLEALKFFQTLSGIYRRAMLLNKRLQEAFEIIAVENEKRSPGNRE